MAVQDYTHLFEKYGAEHNVDPALLAAIATQESAGDPKATGPKTKWGRAKGLMQLIDATAKNLGVTDPYDPDQAVRGAALLLSQNLDQFGNVGDAVAAYHGGPSQKLWGPKTRKYREEVLGRYGGASQAQGQDAMAGSPEDDDLLALARGDAPKAAPRAAAPATQAPSAVSSASGDDADLLALAKGEAPGSGKTIFEGSDEVPSAAQEAYFIDLHKRKKYDLNAEPGSESRPYAIGKNGQIPDKPGDYYVDRFGERQRIPVTGDLRLEAQEALKAGDSAKGRELMKQWLSEAQGAFMNRAASGALLGGKNELIAGAQAIPEAVGGRPIDEAFRENLSELDTADAIQHSKYPMASDAGAVTGTLASTALLPQAGGANLFIRGAKAATTAAGVGGVQGFLGTDGSVQERAENALEGAKTGAIVGPLAEVASMGGGALANRITGGGVSRGTADLASAARDKYGMDIRAGQISASPPVKMMDSVLSKTPFTGYAGKNEAQKVAFTKAVAKTFGEEADGLTPDVMKAAKKRIGGEMNDIASRTPINADAQFLDDLAMVEQEAVQVLTDAEVAPLRRQMDNVLSKVDQSGAISGDVYQSLTRKGTPLDLAENSPNPNIRHFAGQIRDALDEALTRSATPEDVAALKTARRQYKNMMTVKNLAAKAGPDGEISPALLLGAVNTSFKDSAFSGGGDLGELAKIGQRFLKEPPNSGTADRLASKLLLSGAGAGGAGAGALWIYQHPEEAAKLGLLGVAGLAGTALAGRGAAAALDNPLYRNMLLRRAGATPIDKIPVLNAGNAAVLSNRILAAPQREPAPAK